VLKFFHYQHGKNNDPWILDFYDWLMLRQETILKKLKMSDPDEVGTVPREDFLDVLTGMAAPIEDEALLKVSL
jgi:hypothetical protein